MSTAELEIRILGPLEASRGGEDLLPSRPKQRALLAYLLLHPGELVSADALVEVLWPAPVPTSAHVALRGHVGTLRRALGSELIQTRPPGYVLRLEHAQLDLDLFERLVVAARRRADRAARAQGLAEALDLWRGEPLSDVRYAPWAQGEIARLEELRLGVLEERIDAELEVGRHARIVPELDSLVARHPLREQLRGQLMLALYRCGRQADALASFREGRRLLVDELGIEPGPELRELERRVLEQDAALGATAEVEHRDAPGAPAFAVAERKLLSVLFADLVGSTRLADGEDPERVRALLERFYAAMTEEVEVAGGRVRKYLGDGLLALFGSPAAQEDHAQRALHAALSMQRRLASDFPELELRIGVNSGEVVVGTDSREGSYVTGDVVNVAARLQQAAAPGQVLAAERTAATAGAAFDYSPEQTVEAKGHAEGVSCRTVLGQALAPRPRMPSPLETGFVGREAELELLVAAYRRTVREGEPHVTSVIGEAGVGKTTLVRELAKRLEYEASAPVWRSGRCLAYGRGITHWPLGEILREQLGLQPGDAPGAALAGREILTMTLGGEPAAGLHPLAARERLHAAWVDLVEEMTQTGPAVLLVEDLHWAEAPMVELLERLVRDVRGPLMLLVTARPELADRHPDWGRMRRNSTTLGLEALATDESARMLEALLGAAPPERLRELALERCEGNPFFLEELLASLIDRGLLRREDDVWILGETGAGDLIPPSVQALLAARIDLLAPHEKAALQVAAVLGRSFSSRAIEELLEQPGLALETLEDRGYVRRSSGPAAAGEREFTFKHALTREVAYSMLSKARRARLHAAVAEWLEGDAGEREELVPFLAHHYAEAIHPADADLAWADSPDRAAQLRERAVAWLRRAAALAVGRYAIDDGLALLDRALALEPDRAEQAGAVAGDRPRPRAALRGRAMLAGARAGGRTDRRPRHRGGDPQRTGLRDDVALGDAQSDAVPRAGGRLDRSGAPAGRAEPPRPRPRSRRARYLVPRV